MIVTHLQQYAYDQDMIWADRPPAALESEHHIDSICIWLHQTVSRFVYILYTNLQQSGIASGGHCRSNTKLSSRSWSYDQFDWVYFRTSFIKGLRISSKCCSLTGNDLRFHHMIYTNYTKYHSAFFSWFCKWRGNSYLFLDVYKWYGYSGCGYW